jgi:hypothetical protein
VLVGLAAVGGVLAAGRGYSVERPALLSGAAWLASGRVGQLTLLDGSSVEVAAQVRVAQPGSVLDVLQQGSTAYAVNESTGSIRRVDGATFEVSGAVTPIRDAGNGLRAFAGSKAVYALDTARGVLTRTDPRTLAPLGGSNSMSGRVDPRSATVDDGGRLWLLDAATGDLVWTDGIRRGVRSRAAGPGAGLLTTAGGNPVLVDTGARDAEVLDPSDGSTLRRVGLDLRVDDRVEVSGAAHAARLYVVASRGALFICPLTVPACSTVVALDSGGGDYGAPVEAAGRVFVPDYRTGKVWIVQADQARVVGQATVVPAGTRFELVTRDGVVFFNDPHSEQAGVIRLDGGVRRVAKYDPKDPDRNVDNANGQGLSQDTQPTQQPSSPPGPPHDPTTAPLSGKPRPTAGGPDPLPPIEIRVPPNPPQVNQDVALRVVAAHSPNPVSARWNFADGQVGDGLTVTHRWSTAGSFRVFVFVTFPDSRTASTSATIVVAAQPTGTLTVNVSGSGFVSSGPTGIACPSGCQASYPIGTAVTLTAAPASGATFDSWQNCPSPSGNRCQVTITAGAQTVTATFAVATWTISVQVRGNGSVSATGGHNCTADCELTYPVGTAAALTAVPAPGFRFDGWAGACNTPTGHDDPVCTLRFNQDTGVRAVFVATG